MRLTAHARCAQNSALFSDRLSGPILVRRTPLQTNLFGFEFKSNHFITLLVLNFRFVDRMLTTAFPGRSARYGLLLNPLGGDCQPDRVYDATAQ